MGFFSIDSTGADRRRERADAEHKARLATLEEQAKRMNIASKWAERELSEMQVGGGTASLRSSVQEVTQALGNPWWTEIGGLTIDDAWRRGFPGAYTDLAYWGGDEALVAHDDTLRNQILKVSRAMYSNHPHARGIINGAIAFVCGSSAWTVEPTPKIKDPRAGSIEPIHEQLGSNPADHPRGIGGQFAAKSHEPPPMAPPAPPPESLVDLSGPEDPDYIATVGDKIEPVPDIDLPDAPHFPVKKPSPEDEFPIDYNLQKMIRREWKRYGRRGHIHPQLGWIQFWVEATLRYYRDGEVFIHLGHTKDDHRLTPRFLNPEDIIPPTGAHAGGGYGATGSLFNPSSNGIEVDPEDPATVKGYWWRRGDMAQTQPRLLPKDQVMHLKHSTDSTIKRGLPLLFTARQILRHFDTWIQQSLKHQRIQSQVAILRQWQNTEQSQVQAYVDTRKYRERDVTTPAGKSINYSTTEMLPIIDAPAGMDLKMASPNGNFGDSEILIRRLLLATAVGVGMSEAMVTADGSNSNYSSTRITQFIPLRHFELAQGYIGEFVCEYYEKWMGTESAMHRLPKIKDELQMDCNVTPARLPNFEAEVVAGTAESLQGVGLIDKRTAREMLRMDPDIIEERMREEQEELEEKERAAQEALSAHATDVFGDAEAPPQRTEPDDTPEAKAEESWKGNGNGSKARINARRF